MFSGTLTQESDNNNKNQFFLVHCIKKNEREYMNLAHRSTPKHWWVLK